MNYKAEEVGQRIKNLREDAGLTQEKLADALNISPDYLGKIETGKRSGSLDVLIDIAAFFDVSLDYLILGKIRNLTAERLDAAIEQLSALRKML